MRVGILGGTGFERFEGEMLVLETPFGDVDAVFGRLGPAEAVFIARHGSTHGAPPHAVRFRANLAALASAKVDRAFAVNAVGALHASIPVPSFLVPDDFVDLAAHAERTFHDTGAVHVDLSEPYCRETRAALVEGAGASSLPLAAQGTYVAVAGPRLETPAEVRFLATLGHIVGMTGAPEAALAREKALCLASLSVVTNAAAGLAPAVRASDVARVMASVADEVRAVLERAAARLPARKACTCARAVRGARLDAGPQAEHV